MLTRFQREYFMFVGAAAKKNKQRGSSHSSSSSGALSNDKVVKDEKDIEQQLEKARSGNHDELQRRKSVIERDIEKKIVAADRFRKLQLKNINDLYDFEIISLQSQCQVSKSIYISFRNCHTFLMYIVIIVESNSGNGGEIY